MHVRRAPAGNPGLNPRVGRAGLCQTLILPVELSSRARTRFGFGERITRSLSEDGSTRTQRCNDNDVFEREQT